MVPQGYNVNPFREHISTDKHTVVLMILTCTKLQGIHLNSIPRTTRNNSALWLDIRTTGSISSVACNLRTMQSADCMGLSMQSADRMVRSLQTAWSPRAD